MAVGNLVKRIQQKMWKDAGINGDAQRIEQMVWMFFLKVYDAQEYEWEIDAEDNGEEYKSIIPEDLRWRNWAPSKDEEGKIKSKFLTGQGLLDFVDDTLFPVLQGRDSKDGKYKGIRIARDSKRHEAIVQEVFMEVNQYMKNGALLRDVIDIIDDVDLLDNEESHAFGDIYESLLRDLQSAGNAGEFYTPRPVTDFVIEKLDPRLGEKMGDLACGTCGFVVSALEHLKKQRETAEDEVKFQNSVMGQEWKPFPYLLGVTNILLHGIKEPMVHHMDSLSHPMSDYEEDGKLNTIAMNPPFGGATDAATIKNFKAEYRSSETADLFMVLIMQRLAENGRAGVVLPDGFLFGTDGPKFAIKKRLLTEFNLHTIVRLPTSVFAPYTSIATNILFFDNAPAEDAPEGYATKETWFYRLDMPEGYKHFSKTKRILPEHFNPVREWWNNRHELEDGAKSRSFTPKEMIENLQCNFDQCKFPKEEEAILTPSETMVYYLDRSEECFRQIKASFTNILNKLHGKEERTEVPKSFQNPWKELADISVTLPDRLKKGILQEAIQGKLGTQDPSDAPASCLLEDIRAEKQKLVEEGVLKKKDLVETPVGDDEVPFNIPKTWGCFHLGEITYNHGQKKPDSDFSYIDIGSIDNKNQKLNEKENILSSNEAPSRARKIVKRGDIIYATVRPYLHNMCIIDRDFSKEPIVSTGFAVLSCIKGVYNKYLFYYLLSPVFDEYANDGDNAKGMAYPAINDKKLYNGVVPLPPLAEQYRIVEKIEELYAEIDNMTVENNININEIEVTDNE